MSERRDIYRYSFGSLDKKIIWGAVTAFVRWPYWKRLWTVQEILLAKDLVLFCGDSFVQWQLLTLMIPAQHNGPKVSVNDGFEVSKLEDVFSQSIAWGQQINHPQMIMLRELYHGRVGVLIQERKSPVQRSLQSAIEKFGFSEARIFEIESTTCLVWPTTSLPRAPSQ